MCTKLQEYVHVYVYVYLKIYVYVYLKKYVYVYADVSRGAGGPGPPLKGT